MKRIIILTLSFLMYTPLMASVVQPHIKVEGKHVTLGDIYSGLSKKAASIPVLIAPEPGKSITLDQDWLSSVARKYSIDYTPLSMVEHVKVTSASEIISKDDIQSALKDSLVEHLKTDAFDLKLDDPDIAFHIPKGEEANVEISRLDVNSGHTRFQAMVIVQTKGQEFSTKKKVAGKIQHMLLVPTLNKLIPKGQVIRQQDIEWVQVDKHVVNSSTITEEALLVDSYPRHQNLKAYQPVKKQDVTVPQLVARNQAVMIVASSPLMRITAKGKALEDGGKDDYIKVENIDSHKVLYATVIGPQKVRVDFTRGSGSEETN